MDMSVYDEKYIKVKVREFRGVIKTSFLSDDVLKENTLHMHCLYNYWFCYENGKEKLFAGLFRRMKIQMKKTKMTKFIVAELESDSESDTALELKSESEPDTE